MKSVTEQEWRDKAAGLADWRKNRTSPPNLDLYRLIVSMVHVGKSVADVGAGQCHLKECLPKVVEYVGFDPFPINKDVIKEQAEHFGYLYIDRKFETVFMLSALDNVEILSAAVSGLKWLATKNIVILTGIGIPPNDQHTVQVDREDLVSVLGEPFQEVEMLHKVYLFEWRI